MLPLRTARRRAPDAGVRSSARAYGDALATGDGVAAECAIDEALAVGIEPAAIQSLVIAPAMVMIGELRASHALSSADEHRATEVCLRSLIRLFEVMSAGSAPTASGGRVLLAAVEGQRHVLGLRMVADVLEAAGYDILYLGEDTRVESLGEFVAQYRPAVAGLSIGSDTDVRLLARSLRVIHDVSPETRVMLGGRSVPPVLWDVGYPRVATTMEVVEIVEDLLAGPPQPLPPAVDRLCEGAPLAISRLTAGACCAAARD